MKKLLVLCLLLACFKGCITIQTVKTNDINDKLDTIIKKIKQNRNFILTLKKKREAANGYYYIVYSDGTILFHPNTLLIGKNFSRYWYMKPVLKQKSGCLSYFFQDTEYYIFFKPISESEILCLSITRKDLTGQTPQCYRKED